jgi:hypothetical protein
MRENKTNSTSKNKQHRLCFGFVHRVRTRFEEKQKNKRKSTSKNTQHKESMNQIKALETEMRKYADGNDEFIKDLFVDLTGQVQQALEREDWFMKWGIHFLPSLTRKFI